MTDIIVVQNVEHDCVIIYIPRCDICGNTMTRRYGIIAPPPERGIMEVPETQQFTIVGHYSFMCKYHPEEIRVMNKAQLDMINSYPVGKQDLRDTNLYNRKLRRKKKNMKNKKEMG